MWRTLITILLLMVVAEAAMAIEKPKYEVVETHEDVEIRRYESMTVAKTYVEAGLVEAGNIAFRRLAGYIFGDNSDNRKISMTAPVMQFPAETEGDGYWITFMMPSEFDIDQLPDPASEDVVLESVEGAFYAVVSYRGGWSEKKYRQHETRLMDAIASLEGWQASGTPMWARYNPPIVPPWFRSNEILVRLDPR